MAGPTITVVVPSPPTPIEVAANSEGQGTIVQIFEPPGPAGPAGPAGVTDLSDISGADFLAKAQASGVIQAAVSQALAAIVGANPLTLAGAPPTAATVGAAYSYTPTVSGGAAPYSFSLSGTLPAGLSFSATTGAIAGTPTATGIEALTVTVTDALGTSRSVTASITVANPVSGNTVLFYDDSTKPLSVRVGTSVTANGITWGIFSQVAMEAGVGNYTPFEWSDGYATADPYQLGGRRDDQTFVPNFAAPTIKQTGYMPVVRDISAGTTTFRAKRRSGTALASVSGIASSETRSDGSFLGAMLNLQHALYGPPPYTITATGITDPDGVQELWDAIWTIQQDSHQSITVPTARVDLGPNGGQNEIDAWERTGITAAADQVFTNQLYNATTSANAGLVSNGGQYVDLGQTVAGTAWDLRLTVTTTGWTVEIKPSSSPSWTTYRTGTHPSDGRFATAPVYPQLDLKAGYRWSDNPSWVKSIDGSTPDFEWSWKTFKLEVPTANAGKWTNRTIDPATIPALSVGWVVSADAIDNSQPSGTVLAALTASAGISYAVYGCPGLGVVGDEIQITGRIPSGSREITVWAARASDGAQFVVATQSITVLDNLQWWDASAKVALNFQTKQVRLLGVADTWASYVNDDGTPTATLQAMLPGFAASGVMVFKGEGGAASFQGLYGYTEPQSRGQFAIQFLGSTLSVTIKDGDGADHTTAVQGMASAGDAFACGVAWAASGIKISGNGGAPASSSSAYLTTSASAPLLWNSGFGDAPFLGTQQTLFLYDPTALGDSAGDLVTDAHLQGVSVV